MLIVSLIWKTLVALLAIYGALRIMIERNVHEKEAAIMWALQHGGADGMFALDVSQITGIYRSQIYLYMERLENRGLIRSSREWRFPFRYRYHFVDETARAALKAADQAP